MAARSDREMRHRYDRWNIIMIEIRMPQLGESVTEGTIGRWLKRPGDSVAKYEPLVEIITDKVDTEVPAPVTGTVLEILVPEGATAPVGTVIARIRAAEEVEATSETAPPAALPVASPTPTGEASAAAAPTGSASEGQVRNPYISPVVARMVAEHRLDLSQIPGTGHGGRVTKQDVLRYLEKRQKEASQAASTPGAPPPHKAPPTVVAAPPTASSAPPLLAEAELLPLTPMRRAIAEHMERSVRTAPHVTTVMEADLSRVVAHREAHKAAFARQGVRLTFTPYFIQAAVAGLRKAPIFNSSFSAEGIMLYRRIHIGVAVALDEGLLVPVVRDADEKNLLGLARIVGDLVERARTRRLSPDETQGGTFTITNHGVTGSLFATPIIHQSQAAILGVGAIVKRPVAVTRDGEDAIAIRPMCYLSLTFDHRVADGAAADTFLAAIKQALERYE